jgi:hypothetical protein
MKAIALFLFASAATHAAEVPYTSGGIGLESREEMREVAPNYNLHLVFSQADGAYVANVAVEVKTTEGASLLRAVAEGPWLYAKLPPGTYVVTAEQNGASITKRVSLASSKPATLHYTWASGDEAPREPRESDAR